MTNTQMELAGDDVKLHADLRHDIHRATHVLPEQGPITVFVHHNTLHAFEHLSFDDGVKSGGHLHGCHAYLPEEDYRKHLQRGRIRTSDLEAVLVHDLGDEGDRLVASFGTRYALRLAMLQFPLRTAPMAELRWVIAETDAMRKVCPEVNPVIRDQLVQSARVYTLRTLQSTDQTTGKVAASPAATVKPNDQISHQPSDTLGGDSVAGSVSNDPVGSDPVGSDPFSQTLRQFDASTMHRWSDRTWEAFTLNFLWRVCSQGVELAERHAPVKPSRQPANRRHRDVLFDATGVDSDLPVHEVLIRFTASFLDQGFADFQLPNREQGFFQSFLSLYDGQLASVTQLHREIRQEVQSLKKSGLDPYQSIERSLQTLGVDEQERESFITHSLLALRGWAGMVWQMESNAEWTPSPAPSGSLVEFLAIRLMLDCISIRSIAKKQFNHTGPLNEVRDLAADRLPVEHASHSDQRAFTIFQIAQARGWQPQNLQSLSHEQWVTLISEIEAFSSLERRRTYHLAFERKYRNETLDAVIAHSRTTRSRIEKTPAYQIACCIDEREESFRRHLEEVDPACETFGIAGFFGVAMYYRGAADAHFTPLCPVSIKPQHYVIEQPLYSLVQADQRRAEARKRLGAATHRAHMGTRTLIGGMVTGVFGSLAAFPLVARILFPRTTARIRRAFGGIICAPATELRLERTEEDSAIDEAHVGYSVNEMADIVDGGLRAMGLGRGELLSRLVIICGHGSASLNNPHEAAHDCGACGGGRGGPNARAFAQMANDARVRSLLAQRGLDIPDQTFFVGGYHNTCDDSMVWYDLDHVPLSHRPIFERAMAGIDQARQRSAHERCRRFESADLSLTTEEALRHVEGRAEDLSQTRPEYGHATNALCFVGRRQWSRGLFLDRRAFLTSYDPAQDDERSSILEGLLRAVIPVCAGINLEYYFSFVDPTGYGCGTKLPHNITSLLGVMDGASSDLRPGLPWQMVEIHEPVRLLFVIETTEQAMKRIIEENEAIKRLTDGEWVQLAIFDAEASRVRRYVRGEFLEYAPEVKDLPVAGSSTEWYRGKRDHLGFASIAVPTT